MKRKMAVNEYFEQSRRNSRYGDQTAWALQNRQHDRRLEKQQIETKSTGKQQ
jgi:hypothetical protein